MAQTTVVISITSVRPNTNPVYTGPLSLEVEYRPGATYPFQLTGTDAEGDPITWSMIHSPLADISPTGLLTLTPPAPGTGTITVILDDGRG